MSGITLYSPQCLMIGDPGPALESGLWHQVLEQLEKSGQDPHDGYTVHLVHNGRSYPVTGIRSRAGNAVHCDTGNRDLGDYETDTGHLAIMSTELCCEYPYESHARWISTDETTSGYVKDGVLTLMGSVAHCLIATVPHWAQVATADCELATVGFRKAA